MLECFVPIYTKFSFNVCKLKFNVEVISIIYLIANVIKVFPTLRMVSNFLYKYIFTLQRYGKCLIRVSYSDGAVFEKHYPPQIDMFAFL